MRFAAEPISTLRLTRFHRWATLWLQWVVAFLDAAGAAAPLSQQAQHIAHAWLDSIERVMIAIVMLRAAPRVRAVQRRRGVCEHRRNDTALRRAVIGSAMRRALRQNHLRRRIAALSQNIETLVVRLLKRLPRGLTRRRPIPPQPEMHVVALCERCVSRALLSDTS